MSDLSLTDTLMNNRILVTTKQGGTFALPFMCTQECFDEFCNFEFEEDEIIVASYPKSGTTWTMNIVSLILNKGKHVDRYAPGLDRFVFCESEQTESLNRQRALGIKPACYHSHFTVELLRPKGKLIYLVRNPKDVCVSFYHHMNVLKCFGNEGMSFDDYFNLFQQGVLEYGSYFEHVSNFIKRISHENYKDNCLLLLYEDMKSDTKSAILKIAQLLGKQYYDDVMNDDVMKDILRQCSFEHMSNTKQTWSSLPLKEDKKSHVIRKGIIGDWKNMMSLQEAEILDKKTKEYGLDYLWKSYEHLL